MYYKTIIKQLHEMWNFNFHNGLIIKYLTKFSKVLFDERV